MTCFVLTGGYNVRTKSIAWIYLAQSPHDDRGTIMTLILQVQKRYAEVNLFKVTPIRKWRCRFQPKNLTPGLTLLITAFSRGKRGNVIARSQHRWTNASWLSETLLYTRNKFHPVPRMRMQIWREVQDQLIREVQIKHYCELGTGQLWTDVLSICFLFKLMVWKYLDAVWWKGVARWLRGQPCHAILLGSHWGEWNDLVQGG